MAETKTKLELDLEKRLIKLEEKRIELKEERFNLENTIIDKRTKVYLDAKKANTEDQRDTARAIAAEKKRGEILEDTKKKASGAADQAKKIGDSIEFVDDGGTTTTRIINSISSNTKLECSVGLGTATAVASTASGTARGLASKPAVLNGKTSNEDLSKEFFLSAASQENVFLMNVDGISSPVVVPEGTYTGTTLASALQLRINQMESTTGKTVNGVTVGYDLTENRLTFTTGTTGPKSQMFVSGAARLGLDDLDVASGSTPVIFDLPSSAAQIDGKNAYVNADTEIVTVAPDWPGVPLAVTVKELPSAFLKRKGWPLLLDALWSNT